MKKLIEPYYHHVGFTESSDDSHLTIYSRTDALNWACRLDMPDCIENVKITYASLMVDENM